MTMSDPIDLASQREQEDLARAIAAARAPIDSPTATGFCLHCDAQIPDTHRWCNAACRDDWQREHPKA